MRRSTDVGTIRIALGVALLARPTAASSLTRTAPSGRVIALTRVLGARYVAQGALDLAVPHDRRLDAAVELLHAGSMLLLARRDRAHARLALLSAAAATALAVLPGRDGPRGVHGAKSGHRTS